MRPLRQFSKIIGRINGKLRLTRNVKTDRKVRTYCDFTRPSRAKDRWWSYAKKNSCVENCKSGKEGDQGRNGANMIRKVLKKQWTRRIGKRQNSKSRLIYNSTNLKSITNSYINLKAANSQINVQPKINAFNYRQ